MGIELRNITVSYERRPAVHHVSGRFCAGIATAVVGPNGAGKSSLLKAIAGVLAIESGAISFSPSLAKQCAYLPQRAEIDLSMPMTVFELVATGLWRTLGAFKGVKQGAEERVYAALEMVGMQEFATRSLGALSMGQLQRVLFARIVVQDAPVILLDEPFNAVDANTTSVLLELVRVWQTQGRTVIAVLHDYAQVHAYFQEVLLLAHEVVAWGAPQEVLTEDNLQCATQRCAHWFERAQVCQSIDLEQRVFVDSSLHQHCEHNEGGVSTQFEPQNGRNDGI